MNHHFSIIVHAGKNIAALSTEEPLILSYREFLDFAAWAGEHGTSLLLLRDTNLTPAFYDLSTGIAGEILQKVSNYRLHLAIAGPFQMVSSVRFKEFMTESNRGSSVAFLPDAPRGLDWLTALA